MEKVQWNTINKIQNGLNNQIMKNHPPSPVIIICYRNKKDNKDLFEKLSIYPILILN